MGKEQDARDWHALSKEAALAALEAREAGLGAAEAARRLGLYGPNRLPRRPPPPAWLIFVRQFKSPIIYVLAVAAALSLAVGEATDTAFIAAVLLINAIIGGVQEGRAEKSSRALQALLKIRAVAVRDGEVAEIDAEDLVPGDVVFLESGNRVPADLRLLAHQGLEVDESLLTGESVPTAKRADWIGEGAAPLGDRANLAHAGTIVTRGRARGLVVATGAFTAVGRLAKEVVGAAGGEPPLLRRMERFTRVVGVAVLVAAAVVAALGVGLRGFGVLDMALFAVALAVSAIPEGLPVAITVALAVATTRMARRGVIVRRLAAVEGLGSCTLIASDKTGTLTCNELTVREMRLAGGATVEFTGEGFAPVGEALRDGAPALPGETPLAEALCRAAVLCNEADLRRRGEGWTWRGDPTDVALLAMARKLGWDRDRALEAHPKVGEIPFEPERRFAANFHRSGEEVRAYVKGAPERVLAMCASGAERDEALLAAAESMAARGYRVLALADGPAPEGFDVAAAPPQPSGLRFLGFVGMIDPLRPGAAAAVAACRAAGVEVAMITGDHPATAVAIARELGLEVGEGRLVTGRELEEKEPEALREIVRRARVFARIAPEQKLALVRAAQEAGYFVAVTGDGVNDAPALRAANIGAAMGKSGTDVAREAAELVVSDDNFATIVAGVEEGRIAYDNVRKVIYLLVSTGAAEVVLVGLSVAFGTPLPLLPVQLLWLNLVTNGVQDVALALEPGEGDELRRRPRPPTERVFNRLMIERTLLAAFTMGPVAFGAFWWMLDRGWEEAAARNGVLLLMVLFENVHIGNCRSETKSAFAISPLRSPWLLGGASAALLIHVGAMHTAFGARVLGATPLAPRDWALFAGLSLTVLLVIEAHKALRRVRRRT